MREDPRKTLERLYRIALEAVDGRQRVKDALATADLAAPVYLLAVGKAAEAMAHGAFEALGEAIAAGLIVTKTGHIDVAAWQDRPVRVLESAHPVPDQRSLDAGAAMLDFITQAPAQAQFLFLLSGGASSLVEVLPAGGQLADLQQLNHYLLGSGLDIHAINRLRQSCSLIKAGRLASWLAGRSTRVLAISDVEGDDPAIIGSGPLTPSRSMPATAAELPAALRQLWVSDPLPRPGDPVFQSIHYDIIATNSTALEAVAREADTLGFTVHRHAQFLRGEAADLGARIATTLLQAPAGIHLWGGEPTVTLPAAPGRGGRMQSLALAAARVLEGRTDIHLLAAGTDGSDGPSDAAGALVDGGTVQRCRQGGHDPGAALLAADAGSALAASGDLLHTGPTGTNVMDVLLGMKTQ